MIIAGSHKSTLVSFSFKGIAGCITPGGDFVLPHKGRPMLGCEKLLVQGIPYFRLLLGNETEVQLGDLAGNAMSLTVVSATMLAAMTCNELRTLVNEKAATDKTEFTASTATASAATESGRKKAGKGLPEKEKEN
jgi:hypothetical protein